MVMPQVVAKVLNKELIMEDIKGSLLLTRKNGENIIIEICGEKIIINLNKATSGRAKIRISAPKNAIINREEVYKEENFLFTIKK
jgi:sRNA-binding carbon storage regulator CsrA